MSDPDVIINLTGFTLPHDYAERVGYVQIMRRCLRACGRDDRAYQPARFFGYYFNLAQPVGASVDCRVNLPLAAPLAFLGAQVDTATQQRYSIRTLDGESEPRYILLHDHWSRHCWLRCFRPGYEFVTGHRPNSDQEFGLF